MIGFFLSVILFIALVGALAFQERKAIRRMRNSNGKIESSLPDIAAVAQRRAKARFGSQSPEMKAVMDSLHPPPKKGRKA